MKLKEVVHEEKFCGKLTKTKFDIHNNRFILFDKYERELNKWALEKVENYLELEVLEIRKSGYNSFTCFVGFPTTHIKIDIDNDKLLSYWQHEFGEVIEE